MRKSAALQEEIFTRADFAWRKIREPAKKLNEMAEPKINLVRALREAPAVRMSYHAVTQRLIPSLVAIPAGILMALGSVFYIPKFFRMRSLRKKYQVGPTKKKPGTDGRQAIERKKCPVQQYKDAKSEAQPKVA